MKKLLSFLLAASIIMSLAACSGSSNASSAESSEAVSSEATATPKATATPAPTTTPEPVLSEKTNLLTGEETLSADAYGKRPVAVMVNNARANLPQYGISAADIIFEIPVEGDITRLMCMYGDITAVPDICSIRSCRYYYPIISSGFDAIYVHWGSNESLGTPTLQRLGTDDLDGISESLPLFGRDQDRLNEGYDLEHTSVFYGTALTDYLKDTGMRTDLSENFTEKTAFEFNKEAVAPESGVDCTDFQITFGSYYWSKFSYNEETKTYYKTHNDDPHMDGKTGEQLNFENILVLENVINTLPDGNAGLKEIEMITSGNSGYYISMGKRIPITWSKAGDFEPIKISDASGKEISINTGKTYITVCRNDSETWN